MNTSQPNLSALSQAEAAARLRRVRPLVGYLWLVLLLAFGCCQWEALFGGSTPPYVATLPVQLPCCEHSGGSAGTSCTPVTIVDGTRGSGIDPPSISPHSDVSAVALGVLFRPGMASGTEVWPRPPLGARLLPLLI